MISSSPSDFVGLPPAQAVAPSDAPVILLAEDDDELRRLLADTLVEDGCTVFSASDGRGLLAMLSAVSRGELPMPWLVLSDVRMPECGGMEILKALRLAEWDVPVLLITAFGDLDLHREAGRRGATLILDKPFDLDLLVHAVRALAEKPNEPTEEEDDEPTLPSGRAAS